MSKMMVFGKTGPTFPPTIAVVTPPGVPAPIATVIVSSSATSSAFVQARKDFGQPPHTGDSDLNPFTPNLTGLPALLDYLLPIQVNSLVVSVRKPISKKVAKLPFGTAFVKARTPPLVPPVPNVTLIPPVAPCGLTALHASFVVDIRK